MKVWNYYFWVDKKVKKFGTNFTTVIDLFDRKVIGWAFSDTMKAGQTTVAAFNMAVKNRPISLFSHLVFHSAKGVQYACEGFTALLDILKNIIKSMGRKGNCWDNAVAASFFKTLKNYLYTTINTLHAWKQNCPSSNTWKHFTTQNGGTSNWTISPS